jgi:hypothetical protein
MSATPTLAVQPIFLSGDVFELLVRKVPAAVLQEVPADLYPEAIGTTRERFEEIVTALGADGRTQGLIGPETAGYLRQALGMAILECSPAEFLQRFEVEQEDARVLMQQISARLGIGAAVKGPA